MDTAVSLKSTRRTAATADVRKPMWETMDRFELFRLHRKLCPQEVQDTDIHNKTKLLGRLLWSFPTLQPPWTIRFLRSLTLKEVQFYFEPYISDREMEGKWSKREMSSFLVDRWNLDRQEWNLWHLSKFELLQRLSQKRVNVKFSLSSKAALIHWLLLEYEKRKEEENDHDDDSVSLSMEEVRTRVAELLVPEEEAVSVDPSPSSHSAKRRGCVSKNRP